jgi:hypothetical protein
MSWFSKNISHPFVAALAALANHPAIVSNPDAAKAVADAKSGAEALASSAISTASRIVADAQVAADPAIQALGTGLMAAVDGYLTSALGPIGATIVAPAANTLIALGEEKAHELITALFAHATTQVKASA